MLTTPAFHTRRQEIAGHAVADLAQEFGTPCYVYDLASIERSIASLGAFDVIRYAQKALSNISILNQMRQQDVVVDAVSAGEIRRALQAGFVPDSHPAGIVYTADVFDRDALDLVMNHQIPVNLGSPDMIDQFGDRAPGGDITLRINPGFGHGHSQKTNTGGPQSKHGIWHEQIEDCLKRADKYGLTVSGMHMHIGSGTDVDHLSQVCGAMERVCETVGPSVKTISAGGGLPVPYDSDQQHIDIEQYYSLWNATRNRLQDKFGHGIELEIEPGRYLVAESGYLIAEIRAIKAMGDNLFYLVDAGFNDLPRPILYGAYHPISIAHRGTIDSREQEVIVAGPLCESGDIFTQREGGFVDRRTLPVASVGDFVILEVAGAYCFSMASNYNSKYRCPEVLIDHGQARLIRRRETADDLLRLEIL